MVNLFYGLPEDLQHKITWMNIHDEMKTLVSQRQSQSKVSKFNAWDLNLSR